MEWWELFVVLFVMLPIMALWIGCIIDVIARPDLGGLSKALWVLFALFFPLIGALVYIISRPPVVTASPGLIDRTWPGMEAMPSSESYTAENLPYNPP